MKAKNIALTIALVLFWAGTTQSADMDSTDVRPYIGVMLDGTPLPDLLVKHLGLAPGQGIRISNVHRDSPADKAGLERDDIIIGFEDEDVDDQKQFINDVRKAGIGTEVSLEIIHLGKRKTVKLKLEPFEDEFDWKYPPEPEIVQSWRPGKIFRLRPGDKDWAEILLPNMPPEFKVNFDKLFKELHTYHHSDGEDYTITIEGNPDDEDSMITVRIGDTEYQTIVKEMDKLPKKYREAADEALRNARKSSKTRRFDIRATVPFWRYDFGKVRPYQYAPALPFGPGDQMFDAINKQMRELQRRLEELERRQKEMLDSKELQEQKYQQREKSIQPEKKGQQRA